MLQLFYDDFLSFVPLQLPQLLDVTTMEQPQLYDDYVLLSFPLADPFDLEEVMDIFEDDMELITLYPKSVIRKSFLSISNDRH